MTAQFFLQCARGRVFKVTDKHPCSRRAARTQSRPWPRTGWETARDVFSLSSVPGRIQSFITSVSLLQLRQEHLTGREELQGTTSLPVSASGSPLELAGELGHRSPPPLSPAPGAAPCMAHSQLAEDCHPSYSVHSKRAGTNTENKELM